MTMESPGPFPFIAFNREARFNGEEQRMRKIGGPRSCYKRNGAPKAAFKTRKEAEGAIPRTTRGLKPYRCEQHGWHLGH
jgi:hypothetical protein